MNTDGYLAKKRVVIVDDSRSMRAWLKMVLEKEPHLEVVGEASDAFEARDVIKAFNPDVITLDIEMPRMSGLEFLERLMALRPMPVVMVSSATEQGSEAAVTALSLGALDCIVKPSGVIDARTCRDIGRRVFSAACGTVRSLPTVSHKERAKAESDGSGNTPVILIGASTGGVNALETVLGGLDAYGPPVVIVQHMPGQFLASFSKLLDRNLPQSVGIAKHASPLARGDIVLAPAQGKHTEIVRRNGRWQCQLRDDKEHALHCPSVDALFSSAAAHGHDVIAALLTGLGRDGAEGMALLHRAGAFTIGQDEKSCVIYGMPKVAKMMGGVIEELPLSEIGSAIRKAVAKHAQRVSPKVNYD